jgi:hypothetical protein
MNPAPCYSERQKTRGPEELPQTDGIPAVSLWPASRLYRPSIGPYPLTTVESNRHGDVGVAAPFIRRGQCISIEMHNCAGRAVVKN